MDDMIKQLEVLDKAGQLTSFLERIDNINLIKLMKILQTENSNENMINLLRKVCVENSYRQLKNYLSDENSKFISRHYDVPLEEKDKIEIEYSVQYLAGICDIDRVIKWCPMLMYLNRVKKLYHYSCEENKVEEILQKICSSFRESILLADSIQDSDNKTSSREVEQYIYKIIDIAKNKKSMTESYSLYTDDMIDENKEILRRLS